MGTTEIVALPGPHTTTNHSALTTPARVHHDTPTMIDVGMTGTAARHMTGTPVDHEVVIEVEGTKSQMGDTEEKEAGGKDIEREVEVGQGKRVDHKHLNYLLMQVGVL